MTALTTAASPALAANWFVQTGQVFRRWIVSSLRQAWGPLVSVVQPVIWVLLFGQVFHTLGSLPQFGGGGYIAYLVPGVLMMTVLYSGAWAGTGYLEDMKSGVMDQLLTAPLARSAIIVGQLLQQLTINLVQSALVLVIGLLGGAAYPGGALGIVLTLVASTLLATAFCNLSTAVALLTRNQVALIGIAQLVVLPATFLSTTMMPAALMPDWIANVAAWNPLTWAVEVARQGLTGTEDWMLVWGRLALLAALATLSLVGAVASIRRYQRAL